MNDTSIKRSHCVPTLPCLIQPAYLLAKAQSMTSVNTCLFNTKFSVPPCSGDSWMPSPDMWTFILVENEEQTHKGVTMSWGHGHRGRRPRGWEQTLLRVVSGSLGEA